MKNPFKRKEKCFLWISEAKNFRQRRMTKRTLNGRRNLLLFAFSNN